MSHTFSRIYRYATFKVKNRLLWDRYYNRIPPPKLKSSIVTTPEITNQLISGLEGNGLTLKDYQINVEDYHSYLKQANYPQFAYYKAGKASNFPEKSLEHYLAAQFLELGKDDVYVDIANGESPTPEIYHNLYGCDTYRQDLEYTKGINGKTIGGDACNMPLSDGFFSKMGLHCSFEHFEHDADMRFLSEANRTLKPHGRLCILPLYLFSEYAIQTNPVCIPPGFSFEADARRYCVKQWQIHHSRFYDIPHFIERVKKNLGRLDLTLYVIRNEKAVDPSCYVKFAAVMEKN